MAHCPYSLLKDLEPQLKTIRGWEFIKEKSPGTFYIKSKPFLHFHINKEERRWADVKEDGKWQEIEIPLKANATFRKSFLNKIQKHYKKFINT